MSPRAKLFASASRSVLHATLAAWLCACGSNADLATIDAPARQQGISGAAIIAGAAAGQAWPSDPLTIETAGVVGDSLIVTVTHGGGCAIHTYQLVVSDTWMESFPVQVAARISHDAHNDVCKALLTRELRISVAPVAAAYRASFGQEHATVSIRLAGFPGPLLYAF